MHIGICNANECIENLNVTKNNSEIQLRWDWPELNTGIDYVYIFEIEDEKETLYELDKRNVKHFSVSRKNYMQNSCYKKTMLSETIRYKIFPIKINGNDTIVLNQQSGNLTETLHKSVIIEYSLLTKSTGNKKILKFVFANLDNIMTNMEVVYNKYDSNNNYICCYPVDIDLILKNDYSIVINRGEQVRLALKDKNSDIIKFRLK